MPSDFFSARWTRSVAFPAGARTFTVGCDDGTRLSVDGTLVIDFWNDHSYAFQSATVTLVAGAHTIVLEFYECGGAAAAALTWTP